MSKEIDHVNINDILFSTNHQKILRFLIENSEEEFYDRQISNLTNVSRAGTNFALRDLAKTGILKKEKRGRMNFYKIKLDNPLVHYLKVLQNISILYPLIESIKDYARKIILFGSAGKGENTKSSDIDIFILTNERKQVEKLILNSNLKEKLQAVIKTQNELVKMKKENSVFYEELSTGIVLWERK